MPFDFDFVEATERAIHDLRHEQELLKSRGICPRCAGKRVVREETVLYFRMPSFNRLVPCPLCEGTGKYMKFSRAALHKEGEGNG